MKLQLSFALFIALVRTASAADYYPPDARFGIYGAGTITGVPGGIPTRVGGAQIDVTLHGWAEGNTAAQNSTALSSAFSASVQGDVILIPAGTYNFNGATITRSRRNRTVRGAGSGSTSLVVPIGVPAFVIGAEANADSTPDPFYRSASVTDVSRGSTSVTIASGTVYPGYREMARIFFLNELSTPVLDTNSTGVYSRAINVILTGQSGTTLTTSQAIPFDYAAALAVGNAYIEIAGQSNLLTEGVGIEGIFFDCSAHSLGTPTFSSIIQYADGCWLKDVKISGGANYPLYLLNTVNCEVNKSQIIGISGGSSRGGMLIENCTNNLYEDSYFSGSPSIYHWGNNVNCVFAYNYISGTLNANHRAYSSHNLYEGNSWVTLQSDGYYGPSSEDTVFRNWVRSNGLASLKRLTRNYNFVGNVVGVVGVSTGIDYTEKWGLPNIGNEASTGTTVQPSLGIWWGDWDVTAQRTKIFPMQLTERTTNYAGVVTMLDPSMSDDFEAQLAAAQTSYPRTRNAFGRQFLYFGARSGNTWPVDAQGPNAVLQSLPALNSTSNVFSSPSGYQEKDLDVLATAIRKANWYVVHGNAIRTGEELEVGETLPASYYRTSQPAFVGALNWPAFDALAPGTPAATQFPAGYRFVNGNEDYLGPSAPTFSTHPTTQTATVGDTVTLTVAGGGSPAPALQWRKGEVNISGATSSSLVLTNVQFSDAGSYDCVATNDEGTATSNAATLTVNAAPSEGSAATIQTLNVGTLNIQ
jgi:hypothetical protein